MISHSSFVDGSCVTGADLAVNTKKLLKHARPRVVCPRILRRNAAQHLQFLRTQCLNGIGESLRSVFSRPRFLLMTNNPAHVTAVNSHHGPAAGLPFHPNKANCSLNARLNEQIAHTT